MKITTVSSTSPNIEKVTKIAIDKIKSKLKKLNYLLVFATIEYDIEKLVMTLQNECKEIQIHGGTSCKGLMTSSGFHSDDGRAVTFWAVSDADGAYGVGYSNIGTNPRKDAAAAMEMALNNANRSGESPKLVFITSAPGFEEELIRGLEDVIGTDVPIAGGSSADNTIEGKWKQFGNNHIFQNGIVVTAMFPSVSIEIGVSFSSGYVPTNKSGIATRSYKRTLYEIDNKPAAEVYNEWTNGAITSVIENGGKVLQSTTLFPIGREVGRTGSVPYYMLSHPESITSDGAINMFTEINKGDHLELMTGSLESLYSRAGRVARFLLENELKIKDISGALIVYCAGCMLTVGDNIDKVLIGIKESINNAPFLTMFTFGEQGCFKNGENHHGNLMITVVIFGRK